MEEGQDRITVIHPKCYPAGGKPCPFFRPDEKTELVWGIKEILENIPVRASENAKAAMIARYGKARFYRFWRNELPLRPEERAYFERVLAENGIAEPPEYGRTETRYLWN